MSDYAGEDRKRNRTLLIVEGNHEKNKLFWLLFKCFGEIEINFDDIWIYGTNIYKLHEDIVSEYGKDWAIDEDDIDLPYVISKKQNKPVCYKDDFTNIIIVFDYERHDPCFSEDKIMDMQKCFNDVADMGKLYINYPMIESYQHLNCLPDPEYSERKIPISLQPGDEYKSLVRKETCLSWAMEFPHRMDNLIEDRFGILEKTVKNICCEKVLRLSDGSDLKADLDLIFSDAVDETSRKTLVGQLSDWIHKAQYADCGTNYWEYMRDTFKEIILHNICKANRIQNGNYNIAPNEHKACFEGLDYESILQIQNQSSRDLDTGEIWVLNTSVLFIAEYNFSMVQ